MMNTANDAFLLVFVFVGIALVGQFVVNRFVKTEVLEKSHTAGEAMMGVVGTLFSVLLGFMIASAMTKYQDAQMYGQLEASNVASVFRVARGLSDIDRPRIRKLCRAYVDDVINTEWPLMQKHQKINHGWVTYQELWEAVVAAVPEDDRLASTAMPRALWIVVGIGALITVAFTYVFASQFNHVQGAMTTLVAAALALNMWLLAAYSDPYSGELRISPSMFELVRDSVFTAPDTPSKFLHDANPNNANK
jgi:hypothetical protein